MHRTALLVFSLLLAATLGPVSGHAASETYGYDAAGRVSQILAPDGSVTRFTYDSLGNLVAVQRGQVGYPPSIAQVQPYEVRAGSSYQIAATGQNLHDATIRAPISELSVDEIVSEPHALSFRLAVNEEAPLGEQTLTVANADGSAPLGLTILPPLPRMIAGPLPLALPDDGSVRPLMIGLSGTDFEDRLIHLAVSHATLAELLDADVVIPAGQTEAHVRIRGLSGGVTTLTLASEGLESSSYALYVTAAYGDINTKFSDRLGVVVGDSEPPAPSPVRTLQSHQVAVSLGAAIRGLDPGAVSQGAIAVPLIIQGSGLQGVDALAAEPADGLSFEGLEVAEDGSSVRVLVSVAQDTELGPRRIVLTGAAPVYAAAPGADGLYIAQVPPEIDSVEPVVAVRGESASLLTIRGRHLGPPLAVALEPDQGVSVGTNLDADAEGTRLLARFSVAPDAPLGERTVRVTTPGGTSSALPAASNKLQIVDGTSGPQGPVASAVLGVAVGPGDPEPLGEPSALTSMLGVSVGPVVTRMAPPTAEIGTAREVELRGSGLADLTEVTLEPQDGVVVQTVAADPSGGLVRVSLLIDPDTAPGWRRLRAFGGDGEIPFAPESAALLLVTDPAPEVLAVVANTLQIGAGDLSLQIHGLHLDRATRVSAEPPDDLVIGSPSVNGDGTLLSISIRANPGAAAGSRLLRVTTPAGTSAGLADPRNTLTLYDEARASPDPLTAPLVGVVFGGVAEKPVTVPKLPAALLGIQVGLPDVPPRQSQLVYAPAVGVALGSFIERVEAPPMALGDTYPVRIFGQGLEGVDGAGVFPGWDVAVSAPVPSPDGTEIMLSVTVPPDADLQPRELRLVAGPQIVPFADPTQALLKLGPGVPSIDSIQPIVAQPGDTLELVVRGHNLQRAMGVFAESGEGLALAADYGIDTHGTELRIRMHVAQDAPIGPHAIRIQGPGGTSTGQASPANTFTVY